MPSSRATIAAWEVRPPPLGHHGGGSFENRLPVGVGRVGHEDVAVAQEAHVLRVSDHPRRPGCDTVADGEALADDVATAFEVVDLDDVGDRPLAVDGLGSCLNDEQLAGRPVLGPFDVHRRGDAATAE